MLKFCRDLYESGWISVLLVLSIGGSLRLFMATGNEMGVRTDVNLSCLLYTQRPTPGLLLSCDFACTYRSSSSSNASGIVYMLTWLEVHLGGFNATSTSWHVGFKWSPSVGFPSRTTKCFFLILKNWRALSFLNVPPSFWLLSWASCQIKNDEYV